MILFTTNSLPYHRNLPYRLFSNGFKYLISKMVKLILTGTVADFEKSKKN